MSNCWQWQSLLLKAFISRLWVLVRREWNSLYTHSPSPTNWLSYREHYYEEYLYNEWKNSLMKFECHSKSTWWRNSFSKTLYPDPLIGMVNIVDYFRAIHLEVSKWNIRILNNWEWCLVYDVSVATSIYDKKLQLKIWNWRQKEIEKRANFTMIFVVSLLMFLEALMNSKSTEKNMLNKKIKIKK